MISILPAPAGTFTTISSAFGSSAGLGSSQNSGLLLLAAAHSGYDLWRDGVRPATIALGRGRSFARAEEWTREIVKSVEKAAHAPAT